MNEHQAEQGQRWLEQLLQLAESPSSVSVDLSKVEVEGSCWLIINEQQLTPTQIQALTGSDGSALDAMQYLANTTLNLGRAEGEQIAYTIELNGYRVRRQAELQALADAAAQHVRDTSQEFEMGALSAAERRQVHTYLKAFDDLETYSRGREPDRRLVVRLAQPEQC